jgi:hypothetical protein
VLERYPYEGGWIDWPYWVTRALTILKEEQNQWEKERLEEKQKKHDH